MVIKMKKILLIAFALVIVLSLVSCKDNPDTTTPEDTTPEVTTPEVTTPEETTPEETTPEVTTPEEPEEPVFTEVNETVYVYNASKLNVRKTPSIEGEKVGSLKENETVLRVGYSQSWSKIMYKAEGDAEEKIYYAKSDYLTTQAPLTFTEVNETVYVIAESTLYIRDYPSLDADDKEDIIACPTRGTSLKRIGIATTADQDEIIWSKVEINGAIGYASSGYLSTEAPELAKISFNDLDTPITAYVVSQFEDGRPFEQMHIRALPSESSNSVTEIPAGTEVSIVAIAAIADDDMVVWEKIICNGLTGYVNGKYLTITPPNADPAE